MIRVLIVDDNLKSQDELAKKLDCDKNFEIVGRANSTDTAFSLAQKLLPDIVLLDLHLPGLMNIYDLIKKLNQLSNSKIIGFASDIKTSQLHTFVNNDIINAKQVGLNGFIYKSDPETFIKLAMVVIHENQKKFVLSANFPKNILNLDDNDRFLLHNITKHGKIKSAAKRLGIDLKILEGKLAVICDKLSLYDRQGHIDLNKLVKWSIDNGFN